MNRWRDYFAAEQRAGFANVAGARAAAWVPVSDRLVTHVLAGELIDRGPITELDIRALDGDSLEVWLRVSRTRLVPAVKVRLDILGQPRLPESPFFVLRIASSGLAKWGAAFGFFDRLPPGIGIQGDELRIDLALLARRYSLETWFSLVTLFEVRAERGRFLVSVEGTVPGPAPAAAG